MNKKSKGHLSLILFISGALVVGFATAMVKMTSDPKMEIIWSVVGAVGIGLVAFSKYV